MLSAAVHVCERVSSQAWISASDVRITGWRSCSHANSLLAAVVTTVNVHRGSGAPARRSVGVWSSHHDHRSAADGHLPSTAAVSYNPARSISFPVLCRVKWGTRSAPFFCHS